MDNEKERKKQRRLHRKMRHHQEEEKDDIFSGSGFIYYGDLDATADGWNEGRVRRLLERNIPEQELH